MKRYVLISILVFIFSGCSKNNEYVEILEKVSKSYLDKHIYEINNIESEAKRKGYATFIFIHLEQEEDYRGNRLYTICLNEKLDKRKTPSKIIKYKDRYIVLYLNDKDMIEKNIPKELQNDYFTFWTEGYWAILMCKDSNKYIVVDNDQGDNLEDIDELNRFKCR
ncbi:MAG: hypothetical protein PHO12_03445 [Bacteroidales bacterium]|nr:hypothetical protein [Bacteroidales bacterium]MDD4684148.1 hypothetical protein [Bacteroidales bacterium]